MLLTKTETAMQGDPHPILQHVRCNYLTVNNTYCNSEHESAVRVEVIIRKQDSRNCWSDVSITIQRGDRSFLEMNREMEDLVRFAAAAYDYGSRERADRITDSMDPKFP